MIPVTERIRQSLVSLHMARALETLDQVLSRLEKGEMTAIEAIDCWMSLRTDPALSSRFDPPVSMSVGS
ncbi:hypothetical protein ACFSDD_25780 [Salipiger marinus]|uniref:hypothetical protein n=1 Tax=Salipiger marinus TaxID=555512 RepID=UPI0036433A8B